MLIDKETVEYQNKIIGLVDELRENIKDIDDTNVKEYIEEVFEALNEEYTLVTIGEVNSGKSAFINSFLKMPICPVAPYPCTKEIHEIRYGKARKVIRVNDNYRREFIDDEGLQRIVLIDTPGIGAMNNGYEEYKNTIVSSCDLVMAVLLSTNISSFEVWKVIASLKEKWNKKIIFIIQQKDLLSEDELNKAKEFVKYKADSLGIYQSMIFCVSAQFELEEKVQESGISEIRKYITDNIVSNDSILEKCNTNLSAIKNILDRLNTSFKLRKIQYDEDNAIVNSVNYRLDVYRKSNKINTEILVTRMTKTVEDEIDKYGNEIISRLEAKSITERFKNKDDFELWLKTVDENYKNILNKAVNRQIVEAIGQYMNEMEDVLEDIVEIIDNRKELININDEFYGSLISGKKLILSATNCTLNQTINCNKSVSDATNELFKGVWKERQKLKAQKNAVRAAQGTATVAAAALIIKAGATVIAPEVVIPCIVTGVALHSISNIVTKSLLVPNMEKEVEKNIDCFKKELEKSKEAIITNVNMRIQEIFSEEMINLESEFYELRKDNYDEGIRITKLESAIDSLNEKSRLVIR